MKLIRLRRAITLYGANGGSPETAYRSTHSKQARAIVAPLEERRNGHSTWCALKLAKLWVLRIYVHSLPPKKKRSWILQSG
jgi:hypothetical protein